MTATILALLEDGPHTLKELATWLNLPRQAVRLELRRMLREGLVNQPGYNEWGLTPRPPVARVAPIQQQPLYTDGARRTLVIDGEEFEVWKSGKDSLIGDVGGMGSSLRGEHRLSVRRGR